MTFLVEKIRKPQNKKSGLNQNVNEIVINAELETVNKWLCSNKLSFKVFHHNQKQVQYPNIKIQQY